jgi:hypothetical protein
VALRGRSSFDWLFDPGWQAMDGPASKEMVFPKALFTSRSWCWFLINDTRS